MGRRRGKLAMVVGVVVGMLLLVCSIGQAGEKNKQTRVVFKSGTSTTIPASSTVYSDAVNIGQEELDGYMYFTFIEVTGGSGSGISVFCQSAPVNTSTAFALSGVSYIYTDIDPQSGATGQGMYCSPTHGHWYRLGLDTDSGATLESCIGILDRR